MDNQCILTRKNFCVVLDDKLIHNLMNHTFMSVLARSKWLFLMIECAFCSLSRRQEML